MEVDEKREWASGEGSLREAGPWVDGRTVANEGRKQGGWTITGKAAPAQLKRTIRTSPLTYSGSLTNTPSFTFCPVHINKKQHKSNSIKVLQEYKITLTSQYGTLFCSLYFCLFITDKMSQGSQICVQIVHTNKNTTWQVCWSMILCEWFKILQISIKSS